MTSKQEKDYAQMYLALQAIKGYQTPQQMRRSSEKDWGLQADEAIEMAYENIQHTAAAGLHGVRRPASPESEG